MGFFDSMLGHSSPAVVAYRARMAQAAAGGAPQVVPPLPSQQKPATPGSVTPTVVGVVVGTAAAAPFIFNGGDLGI